MVLSYLFVAVAIALQGQQCLAQFFGAQPMLSPFGGAALAGPLPIAAGAIGVGLAVEGGPCAQGDGEPNMRPYPGNPNFFLKCSPLGWPNRGYWVRMACGLGTWFLETSQRCEMPGTTGVILPTAHQTVAQNGPFGTVVQTNSRTQNPDMCPDGSVAVTPCDPAGMCPNGYYCTQAAGCCLSQAGQCPVGMSKLPTWNLCDVTQPCPPGASCFAGQCCVGYGQSILG